MNAAGMTPLTALPEKRTATRQPRMRGVAHRLALLLLLVLGLLLAYYLLQRYGLLDDITDADRLRSRVDGLGVWGPLILVGVMALAIVINPIPSAPIALAAGAAYGHTWGTVYVVAGATLGALAAFGIARLLGHELLSRLLGRQVIPGWLGSQNTLTAMVFVSRLLPFLSFDLVSYGAGLTPIRAWRFALATLLGLIPASFLLAHFGGELSAANMAQALRILLLLGGVTLLPLAAVAGVKWYRRPRGGR